uniref:Wsv294-like protein n=1 Tax=Metapenaeus ensis nimavirus TaxID=2133794 RepID=A0A401IPD9_9VIRU|nr:MAG: wsv294-like protein [Metapenaeus ensis nimavirus]GBG35472.1 wsv294-like protein [Metapenaeus ensis nimavirus]
MASPLIDHTVMATTTSTASNPAVGNEAISSPLVVASDQFPPPFPNFDKDQVADTVDGNEELMGDNTNGSDIKQPPPGIRHSLHYTLNKNKNDEVNHVQDMDIALEKSDHEWDDIMTKVNIWLTQFSQLLIDCSDIVSSTIQYLASKNSPGLQ